MGSLHRSTELDAPATLVWQALMVPEAFVVVSGALLRFPAAERHGRRWRTGDVVEGWTLLFGLLPWSRHRLEVHAIDDEVMRFESRERGGLVRRWDHVIEVTAIDGGRCRYTDRLVIDAGLVTPVVVAFGRVFYAYRQRNWRRLARVVAAAGGSETG